jgi:hypothetical protein
MKRCGKRMLASVQREMLRVYRPTRKSERLPQIACELPPGHEGNHVCSTKRARYEWWNEERNPQKKQQATQ